MRDNPQAGETWVHCKGGEYEIIAIASCSEDGTDQVVYQDRRMGKIWVRSLTMFMSNHESGALRFTRKA